MKEKLKLFLTRRNVIIISVVALVVLLLIVIVVYTLSLQNNKVGTQTPVSNVVSMPVVTPVSITNSLPIIDSLPIVEMPTVPALKDPFYSPKDSNFISTQVLVEYSKLDTFSNYSKGQDVQILGCDVEEQYQAINNSNWTKFDFFKYNSNVAFLLARPNNWKVYYVNNTDVVNLGLTGCYSNTAIDIRLEAYTQEYVLPTSYATTSSGKYAYSLEKTYLQQQITSGGSSAIPNGYSLKPALNITIYDTANMQQATGVIKPLNLYSNPNNDDLFTKLEAFVTLWISKM